MSPKEKPDGWVAWHPTEYFLNEIYGSEREAWASLMGFVHPEKVTAKLINADPEKKNLLERGWRIRPMKIIFLDNDKAGK